MKLPLDYRADITFGARVRPSPFFDRTVAAGCTAFTIYNHMYMPTSYGDAEGEYWRLINDVSLWDVACQRQVELFGPDALNLAQLLTPRDLSDCIVGQGLYVPICNHFGGMLNDPVLLRLAEDQIWLSLADGDLLLWVDAIAKERNMYVLVTEPDASPLAVQGPKAEDVIAELFGDWVRELRYFWFRETELQGIPLVLARSGWSKQGGYELYLTDGAQGGRLWDLVMAAGAPHGIGPGTPNQIERTESALLSHGGDMDADVSPLEIGLERFCDLDKPGEYIGMENLRHMRDSGPPRRLVGLFIDGEPLPNSAGKWPVHQAGAAVGQVSSAVHSPRLHRNIAMALLKSEIAQIGNQVQVTTPAGERRAEVTELPFIR